VPLWYDIISVLTLSLTGVLNAVSSIVVINAIYLLSSYTSTDDLFGQVVHDPLFWLITVGAIILSSFGIYLGRYIRVSSWDITHPHKLLAKIGRHLFREKHLSEALLFTLFFSVFLFLMYMLFMSPGVALLGGSG